MTDPKIIVKGFVNGHLVFQDAVRPDVSDEVIEAQLTLLSTYERGPDDVSLLEICFPDGDCFRLGTDRARMVLPVEIPIKKLRARKKK